MHQAVLSQLLVCRTWSEQLLSQHRHQRLLEGIDLARHLRLLLRLGTAGLYASWSWGLMAGYLSLLVLVSSYTWLICRTRRLAHGTGGAPPR